MRPWLETMLNFDKHIKKELARDCIALGSILFYLIVIARVSMLSKPVFLFQFIFAGIIFFLLSIIFKLDLHSGLGFILLVFISLYYNNVFFTIFAILIYLLLIVSLFYLKIEKSKILKGILIGLISTVISYFIVGLL